MMIVMQIFITVIILYSFCMVCYNYLTVLYIIGWLQAQSFGKCKFLCPFFSGEFMQLGSKEEDTERFNHYLKKTYKKTASLIANSCKAVSIFCLPY